MVGDITPAELAELLRATFGVLPAKATPADVMEVSAFDGGVHIIDMDVPQSAMAFAQGGLKRDDPRFYSLTVLNQVLGGGGLTSRLFDEVREEARVGLLRLHRAGSARSLGARPRRRGHGQRAGCGHNPGHPRPMAAARGGWRRHRRTRGQQNLSHGSFLCASPAAAGSPRYSSRCSSTTWDRLPGPPQRLDRGCDAPGRQHAGAQLLAPDQLTFIIVGDPRLDRQVR